MLFWVSFLIYLGMYLLSLFFQRLEVYANLGQGWMQ